MVKFRIVLGIILMLMGPMLFYFGLNAKTEGIDLAEPTGAKGAALFDWLGPWGLLAVCWIGGISEILTAKKLLQDEKK